MICELYQASLVQQRIQAVLQLTKATSSLQPSLTTMLSVEVINGIFGRESRPKSSNAR